MTSTSATHTTSTTGILWIRRPPAIVGGYLKDKHRKPLARLAKSASLWKRRISVVATQHFIRLDQLDDTLTISRHLLSDGEDLIHMATGWMLREVGDRDWAAMEAFLDEHVAAMPRTMLRYAIEHFPPEQRQAEQHTPQGVDREPGPPVTECFKQLRDALPGVEPAEGADSHFPNSRSLIPMRVCRWLTAKYIGGH